MPAALDVNWVEVQMLALEVGVREAARSLNISEEAVMKRCSREGWIKTRPANVPLPPTMLVREQPCVRDVRTNAAEVFKRALLDRGNKSRLAMAKGLGAAADHVATLTGDQVLAQSKQAKDITSSLATVHGWEANQNAARLDLHLTCGEAAPTIDVESVEAQELP